MACLGGPALEKRDGPFLDALRADVWKALEAAASEAAAPPRLLTLMAQLLPGPGHSRCSAPARGVAVGRRRPSRVTASEAVNGDAVVVHLCTRSTPVAVAALGLQTHSFTGAAGAACGYASVSRMSCNCLPGGPRSTTHCHSEAPPSPRLLLSMDAGCRWPGWQPKASMAPGTAQALLLGATNAQLGSAFPAGCALQAADLGSAAAAQTEFLRVLGQAGRGTPGMQTGAEGSPSHAQPDLLPRSVPVVALWVRDARGLVGAPLSLSFRHGQRRWSSSAAGRRSSGTSAKARVPGLFALASGEALLSW